jgi:ribosome-binding protein aMBF1 (putative translation factor)
MNRKAQVIFDNGKPAFVVLPYRDYLKLTGDAPKQEIDKAEFVPFILSDYVKNPIRLKRIEAGLNQQQLAKLLKVTQGYVSRIESRNYVVTDALMERVKTVLAKRSVKR